MRPHVRAKHDAAEATIAEKFLRRREYSLPK
jgi:hypothetical protein